ncbi:MAG: Gamma-glutamyl phosphate reductase (EC [uncultured Campylobacterales bacterium]|uniref:Gamma-glutamyl phosphate reductase n=1 Tax=uncultured Campylobacterales bacterium TaxID=352960 RepID=A0A6S6SUW0_9BACT|nr:MAG: Gamma-glutamyl phosphate reductase (EC [uncultured Campylobacterales bacterium]
MQEFFEKCKQAKTIVANLTSLQKNNVLLDMANSLLDNTSKIINENKKDLKYAKDNDLSDSMLDRLLLDESRVQDMADSLKEIAALKEPVGRILEGWKSEQDLKIQKISVPIGCIGIIYESRPNVTSDAAALCFKSGNVSILKGGKEANYSNNIIATLLQDVLVKHSLPEEIISLLPDNTRAGVEKLIKMDKYVDLIIPRGGESLIKYVSQNATVSVVKHDKGLCHTYIDKTCDEQEAIKIAVNAKTQRTGVCNTTETLLVHTDIANKILPKLKAEFDKKNTELRGCQNTTKILDIKKANNEDFETEYLDNILSIKVVDSLDDAIKHISKYGSGHSEAILSSNYSSIEQFLNEVDSACVYANASTRFTDGAVFGFGAEVGISTNKLHSRGPMGINDLTTYKFKIYGDGQIRE